MAMKGIFTFIFALHLTASFSQWTRLQQLPSSDIFSLYRNGNALYAGGRNIIYFSFDKGQTWDSTKFIPQLSAVDNIIVFKNELYASSFNLGVQKSVNGGASWQPINTGIIPAVSDFCEWKGD